MVDDFAAAWPTWARGPFEDYDFGEDFRTVDGIVTLPNGRKGAWFKDSKGNILGISKSGG